MEDNMNKSFWIGLVVTIVVAVILFLGRPTYDRIQEQQSSISGIQFSSDVLDGTTEPLP